VPANALGLVGALVRNSGTLDITAEDSRYLNFGRVVDTTRMRVEFGFQPRYSTGETVEAYLQGLGPRRRLFVTGASVGSAVLRTRLRQRVPSLSGG
jgi:hypothetical protein